MKQGKGICVVLLEKHKYRMKHKFTYQEFQRLYVTGSNEGRFYSTVKAHKVPKNGLPIRPMISNQMPSSQIPCSSTVTVKPK